MRVLIVHNSYRLPGGEDLVVTRESDLLLRHGNEVQFFRRSNRDFRGLKSPLVGIGATWNQVAFNGIAAQVRSFKPDIVHVHNVFPIVSPAAYYAPTRAKIPVVQTLHNYRLACPSGDHLRNGAVCEDCVGAWAMWPSVLHGCYHNSRLATLGLATSLNIHKALGTFRKRIHAYIAPTDFVRRKLLKAGIPGDRVFVKPNFVDEVPGKNTARSDVALFVGRLSDEKGADIAIDAWRIAQPRTELRIIGDGPLRAKLQSRATGLQNVRFLGQLPHNRVLEEMRSSRFIVFPSRCYEAFPLVIVEALAAGLAVVAARGTSAAAILEEDRTALLFALGDASDLAGAVKTLAGDWERSTRMGGHGRADYEARFTGSHNYKLLTAVYEQATLACNGGK